MPAMPTTLGSADATTFEIEQAATTTVLTCPLSVIYSGAAQEPCSAEVTGPGGLNEVVTVLYTDNTNVGTASALATYAGDANYLEAPTPPPLRSNRRQQPPS